MKKHPLAVLAALSVGLSPGFADDQPVSVPEPAPSTSARLLGALQGGSPPPPVPPKPKFIVAAKDVLETTTHQQGGRTITVRKIAPISLPPPPEITAAPSVDLTDPAVQARIAKFRAANHHQRMLLVGATVYRFNDSPPRSQVQIWPQAEGEPLTVWSSADFALLSGFSTFADSADSTTSLLMMWSVTNLDDRTAFHTKFARSFKAPEIPQFSPGKATFVIASGNPTPQSLASLQSLHDLYNNEYERLKTAYEGRERAQRLHEAELKANPSQPKDIVLNYWFTDSAEQAGQGGSR
ncbi:hypothetical protein HQ447_14905 [bacterium]|nr:hypothetical protein [bacterium]